MTAPADLPLPPAASKTSDSKQPKDQNPSVDEDLNEEDLKLKEELELLVDVLTENKPELYEQTLNRLTELIRTSTSSMTAVPKPLKFLKPHYDRIVKVYESWPENKLKTQLAGILSVLGMTVGTALHYRLLAHDFETSELEAWGHEYLRHLALEIGDEYHKRHEQEAEGADGADVTEGANGNDDSEDLEEPYTQDLLDLALKILPFFLKHNAETDAVDLLLEVESVEKLSEAEFVDSDSYNRVCQYLVACASYVDMYTSYAVLNTAYTLYKQNNELPQALLLAFKLDNKDLVKSVFNDCQDPALRKQLAFILARHNKLYNLGDDDGEVYPEDISDIARNTTLVDYFKFLIKELNLQQPKKLEDVLATEGEDTLFKGASERNKMVLVSILSQAFMNAGFATSAPEFKPNLLGVGQHSDVVTAASYSALGLNYLWDYQSAIQVINSYMESPESAVRAGSVLGLGVATNSVHDENETPLGILSELLYASYVGISTHLSIFMTLGFEYAGTCSETIPELVDPVFNDQSAPISAVALAALCLGLTYIGSGDGSVTSTILVALMERDEADLNTEWAPFMGLGLALLYMGKPELVDEAIETVKAIEHPISQTLEILIVICAYAGTGNVLQIQRLLREAATRHYEDDETVEVDESPEDATASLVAALASGNPAALSNIRGDTSAINEDVEMTDADKNEDNQDGENNNQSSAILRESAKTKALCTLGVGMIAMGENIGEDMVLRHLEHLMHYGDSYIRRAVPLTMGLVYTSNPQMKVYETLSRYTHESDDDVAANAIFAMGLVGAGTLNARIAQLLRQLDEYHSRNGDLVFMVRFALGLLNLGKGTQTLSPFMAEKKILNPVAVAGLLITTMAMMSPAGKQFVTVDNPSMLFSLSLAVKPRMLVTVDEDLKPLKVTVRVGQAVDTVGQAGNPKRITGWVTQDTPVLLSTGERAELESDEYEPLSHVLEGIVILRKKSEESSSS